MRNDICNQLDEMILNYIGPLYNGKYSFVLSDEPEETAMIPFGLHNITHSEDLVVFHVSRKRLDKCKTVDDIKELCVHCISIMICMGEDINIQDILYLIACAFFLSDDYEVFERIKQKWLRVLYIKNGVKLSFPRHNKNFIDNLCERIPCDIVLPSSPLLCKKHILEIYDDFVSKN